MKLSKLSSVIITHPGFEKLTGKLSNGESTLLELLESKANALPNNNFLGVINEREQVEYLSYKETLFCVKKIGLYLSDITKPKDSIGIASFNRPEWLMAEYATYSANCINIPLHTTFDDNSMTYILFLTKMKVLITSAQQAELVLTKIQNGSLKNHIALETIILMDHNIEIMDKCRKAGYQVTSYSNIIFDEGFKINPAQPDDIHGYVNIYPDYFNIKTSLAAKISIYFKSGNSYSVKANDKSRGLPVASDIASYCFTSGTSGAPKGVKLTHANFIYQVEGHQIGSADYNLFDLYKSDVYMSYLPLSHVLERVCFCICINKETLINFWRGDKTKFVDDLLIAKPTFMPAVPLVLNNFYEKVEMRVSNLNIVARTLFRAAMKLKIKLQEKGIFKLPIIDSIVFKKSIDAMGGKLRGCICGGANIDPYLIKYCQAAFNFRIFQGYGQTEGVGANIVSVMDDCTPSTVGVPFVTTQLKLIDMDENCKEKELLMRGPSITSGYLKPTDEDYVILEQFEDYKTVKERLSVDLFDEEGFLKTGDIATFENEKITIVGRDSNIVKFTNGEYIVTEDVENKIQTICKFEELYVLKTPGKDTLTAIIGVTEADITDESVINKINSAVKELIEKKQIPKITEIAFVAVLKNFRKEDYPEMYTPKNTKKRYVSASNGKFYEMINQVMPNVTKKCVKRDVAQAA